MSELTEQPQKLEYTLECHVRQQPEVCRASSFQDRRYIHPTPMYHSLLITSLQVSSNAAKNWSSLVASVTLCNPDNSIHIQDTYKRFGVSSLIGSTVTSCERFYDEFGIEGYFFVGFILISSIEPTFT